MADREQAIVETRKALRAAKVTDAAGSSYEQALAELVGGMGHNAETTRLMLESLAEKLGYYFDHENKAVKR